MGETTDTCKKHSPLGWGLGVGGGVGVGDGERRFRAKVEFIRDTSLKLFITFNGSSVQPLLEIGRLVTALSAGDGKAKR